MRLLTDKREAEVKERLGMIIETRQLRRRIGREQMSNKDEDTRKIEQDC